jgi:hypothetical protein
MLPKLSPSSSSIFVSPEPPGQNSLPASNPKNPALDTLKNLVADRKQVPDFETARKGEIDNGIKYGFRSYLVWKKNVPIMYAREIANYALSGRYTRKEIAKRWNDIGGKSLEQHWNAYQLEPNENATSGVVSEGPTHRDPKPISSSRRGKGGGSISSPLSIFLARTGSESFVFTYVASSPEKRDGFREFAGKLDAQTDVALTCLEILSQLKAHKFHGLSGKLSALRALIREGAVKVKEEDDEYALDKPIKELVSSSSLDDEMATDLYILLAQRLLPLTGAAVTELHKLWTKYSGSPSK